MFTQKDPNAMDVDAMSIEERNELMKKGHVLDARSLDTLAKIVRQRTKQPELHKKFKRR